ncbi:hypothetical protein GC508_11045 [Corynebacterium sp. zg910]|nr:hypothetical protein [Corynebacterium lujinxingii]
MCNHCSRILRAADRLRGSRRLRRHLVGRRHRSSGRPGWWSGHNHH